MGQALIGCCPVATANQSSPHSGPILSNPAFDEAQLKDVKSEDVDDKNAEVKEKTDDETREDNQT